MRKLFTSASVLVAMCLVLVGCAKQLPTEIDRSATTDAMAAFDLSGCELSIGDRVWRDLNEDGVQDANEPGLAGIQVKLIEPATKNVIAMAITDGQGYYAFTSLCAGEYEVMVMGPKECWPTKNTSTLVFVKLDKKTDDVDFGFNCKDMPPPPKCEPCKGGVAELTLRYIGQEPNVQVTVKGDAKKNSKKNSKKKSKKQKQSKKNSKKGNGLPIFDGQVSMGGEFNFSGDPEKCALPKNITICVDGRDVATIHTSCSKPIGPGMIFGPFEVTYARSCEGGDICPVPPGPPTGGDLCSTFGKPKALELLYTGNDCSASSHDQADGKASCTDLGGMPNVARIVASSSSTPGDGDVWFVGDVAANSMFIIDAANAGKDKFNSNTWLHIYNGQTLVQTVQFHTSCSQPLRAGDNFGAVEVVRFVR